MVQLLTPEESTLDNDGLSHEARWSYYVSAYTMRDPTEGVSFADMRLPFLKRSLPPKLDSGEQYSQYYKPLIHQDGLVIRICANSYHILYEPGTEDWWYRRSEDQAGESKDLPALTEKRNDRFKEKFVNNPSWAQGLSKDEVDKSNQQFRSWVGTLEEESGPAPASAPAAAPPAGEGSRTPNNVQEDFSPPKEDEEMGGVTPGAVASGA